MSAIRLAERPPFNRVLIANRGEIAVRVVQACRDLGLHTVAVYSEADRTSRHADLADRAICVGPVSSTRSYLDQDAILSAAEISAADAIHPGYGFLAENAEFAERVESAGLTWIGPAPETIRLLGDKAAARLAAEAAKVPVLPGTLEPPASSREALSAAEDVGFPVLLKAVSGGGGKGMRVVERAADFERLFDIASREAELAFDDARVYVERFLINPRHIEVQIFGEASGTGAGNEKDGEDDDVQIVNLGTRECSIQRRHQKLLEEAPPVGVDGGKLAEMGDSAVRLAGSVAYRGAGTVEFLLDSNGDFFFMEMNTRVQVEHPVTEVVTGTDLVVAQLLCAQGRSSGLPQAPLTSGHAIECRLNAEDPTTFTPSPGRIDRLRWPTGPGVRIDSHVYEGYLFPPFYDSLLGKVITHGQDRSQAIARMTRALGELEIGGIQSTADLHRHILQDEQFRSGSVDTGYLERFFSKGRRG